MNKENLDSKTFICYPEFKGMKQRITLIILCFIIGIFLILSSEVFNIKAFDIKNSTLNSFGLCFLLLSLLTFLITKVYTKNVKYILTSKRLTIETGVLSKKISNLELWRIIDIELTQDTIQLFFGSCKLKLDTEDISDPIIYIEGLYIEYAKQLYDLLNYFVDKSIKNRLIEKSKDCQKKIDF